MYGAKAKALINCAVMQKGKFAHDAAHLSNPGTLII